MAEPGDHPRATTVALQNATKRFGSLTAVSDLSVTLEPGRIHALIGENGAGKSTALKMLAGMHPPTSGEVIVGDSVLHPVTTREAFRRGIGMVHQHFMLIDAFSALDNVMVGDETTADGWGRWLGRLDRKRAKAHIEQVAERSGLRLDLSRPTSELSVGEKQRLEILKVLSRGATVILLDEPTAVLSPVEAAQLYTTLRALANEGSTVAVVTHHIDEVIAFCDHATVMRRGVGVLDRPLPGPDGSLTDEQLEQLRGELTRAIMGGEPPGAAAPPERDTNAHPVLDVRSISVRGADGRLGLNDVSLSLQPGQILGVAGIEGNGQSELARALAGLQPLDHGAIDLCGTPLFHSDSAATTNASERVRLARSRGLLAVHDDRHRDEMIGQASVADNLIVGDLPLTDESTSVRRRFECFDVYPPDTERPANELSGGNQQKVVMARALDRALNVLVLSQPTRGVDIGTARTIHHRIARAAEDGAAVILISADLTELRSLCHELVVLHAGSLVAQLDPSSSDEVIGRAMLGTAAASAPGVETNNENISEEAPSA